MDMANNTTNIGGWGELIPDLLLQIKQRLPLPDLIRFSCVCTSWRSLSAPEIRHKNRLPWLIVPYVVDNNSPPGKDHNYCRDGVLGFFSILDGQTYKLEIPELYERRICGTSYGWLITVHANSEMHLLHPFTRELLNLPPLTKSHFMSCSGVYGEQDFVYHFSKNTYIRSHSPEDMRDIHVKKVITVCEPKSGSPHPPVAVCINYLSDLYFSRHGADPCWTRIDCGHRSYVDLAIYKGNLFALSTYGEVHLVTGLDGFSPQTYSLFASSAGVMCYNNSYLVASSTELLLIVRFYTHKLYDEYCVTERFRVSKLVITDPSSGRNFSKEWELAKWVEIKNLGDRALFLGFNESFSVVASDFPGCKANSIYFSDDTTYRLCRGHDKGIFSLDDGTIEKIYPIDSKYVCPRPIWYATNP